MTDRKPGLDQCEQHLIALRDELAGRGVRCALDDRGLWPRLRIYCPDEGATAEFDNNVVAAPISGRWCFCWPWAVPIGSVSRVAQAAEDIINFKYDYRDGYRIPNRNDTKPAGVSPDQVQLGAAIAKMNLGGSVGGLDLRVNPAIDTFGAAKYAPIAKKYKTKSNRRNPATTGSG